MASTRARMRLAAPTGQIASANLLGLNLDPDRFEGPIGIQAERLVNPFFAAPADGLGIAHGWIADAFTPPYGGWAGQHFSLVPGISGPGRTVQMVSNDGGGEIGLVQPNLWFRAGETLELTIRARAQYRAADLRVGLRPISRHADDYASARITVDPAHWVTVRTLLVVPEDDDNGVLFLNLQGTGRVWLDQVHLAPAGSGAIREDFSGWVRTLGVPTVRFPGSGGIVHRWRNGIGPVEDRPVGIQDFRLGDWKPSYGFGTDEYLAWCLDLGIQPHVAVNISSGTPDEARDWAAHVADWHTSRGIEPPTMYWQIGNEPWLPYDLAHMTPEWYAKTLEAYVPGIRAAYPNARIIASAQETSWDDSFDYADPAGRTGRTGGEVAWRDRLLAVVNPEHVDVLGMQIYEYPYHEDPREEYLRVFACAQDYEDYVRRAVSDTARHGLAPKIAITEWNLWIHANAWDGKGFFEPYSLEHVLYYAEVVQRLVGLSRFVEVADFYCLNGPMRVLDVHGPVVEATDLARVYQLYRPAFPGRVVPVELDSPLVEGRELEAVAGMALVGDSADGYVFLVNRDPEHGVTIETDGVVVSRISGLEARGPRDRVSEFGEDIATAGESSSEIQLPPSSVSRLDVRLT